MHANCVIMHKRIVILLVALLWVSASSVMAGSRDTLHTTYVVNTDFVPMHVVNVSLGGGLHTLLPKMTDEASNVVAIDDVTPSSFAGGAGGGGQVQATYTYFFHKYVGITGGVGFEIYSGNMHGSFRDRVYLYDTDNRMNYYLNSDFKNFKESEQLYLVTLPVGVTGRVNLTDPIQLRGTIGIGMNIVASSHFRGEGQLETTADYPDYNLHFDSDLPQHGFSNYYMGGYDVAYFAKDTEGHICVFYCEYFGYEDEEGCNKALKDCSDYISDKGAPYAIVVRKNTFSDYSAKKEKEENYEMSREEAIGIIADKMKGSLFVSTTGMASRELYEIRDKKGESHDSDFLTVGSMGHSSQIALGMALNLPDRRIVCIDGDGASIMHMGGMATIASESPYNLTHILINNGVHDSVGGQPTVSREIDLHEIAEAMGYANVFTAEDKVSLEKSLECTEGPVFIQVMVHRGARKDLGRPKSTPIENKDSIMKNIGSI